MDADQIDIKIPPMVQTAIQSIDMDSEVVLFGSRAKGYFRMDSDWGFLILLTKEITPSLKESVRDSLYDIEVEFGQEISSILYQRAEWELLSKTSLYQIMKEEGVKL